MRLSRGIAMVLVAGALAALAAGCGGSDSSSDSSTSSTTALKGDPIVLGTVCSCSGASASSQYPLPGLYKAWEQSVNENGGINGHPVKLVQKDDAGNAEASVRAVKELVEQDHVVAIVGPLSQHDAAWAKYVEDKGVPVIGNFDQVFSINADFFPTEGSLFAGFPARMDLMTQLGETRMGVIYCAETPLCAQSPQLLGSVAETDGRGITVPFSAAAPATAPNYQAQCLGAKDAKVDMLDIVAPADTTNRVIDACAQQGYKPSVIAQPSKETIDNPNAEGLYLISPSPSNMDLDATEWGKQFKATMEKYDPSILSDDVGPNLEVTNVWSGLVVFEAAAKRAKLTPTSTSADVKQAMYDYPDKATFGNLTPPLTWVKDTPTQVNCWFTVQQKDGVLVQPNGAEAECLSPEQVKALQPLYKFAAGM